MLKSKLTLGTVAVACLLIGWFAGNWELPVEAQRDSRSATGGRQSAAPRFTTPTETEVLPTIDCVFTIVEGIAHHRDRGTVLLDECTGETWYYDNGWNADAGNHGAYTRDATWRSIILE